MNKEIKHTCEKCALLSEIYAKWSKHYIKYSKMYADKCQCEVKK